MKDMMITAKELTKTYERGTRKVKAVRGIDLKVQRGQIFGQAESLPARLEEAGVIVTDFNTTTPSLEDVFIARIEDLRDEDSPRRPLAPLPENRDVGQAGQACPMALPSTPKASPAGLGTLPL